MDLQHLDELCDKFEAALQAGKEPRIEDFTAQVSEDERPQLFLELLETEIELAVKRAEDKEPDALKEIYQKRFPEKIVQINEIIKKYTPLRHIGDYEIIKEIGHGGMGVVYKAKHLFLNQTVAVKVLPENLLHDEQAVNRFRREMQLIGSLNHPNVVRALNAGEFGTSHYLAMEYVDGITLERLILGIESPVLPKISSGAACEAIRQAALGLQNAHELQLVHRDIKPANLMVDQGGTVKILDLGLGKFQSDPVSDQTTEALTCVGMTLGTVDYISPEQCENAAKVDIRSDLYSLGCTLYFLLTGIPVYSGSRYDSLRKKLMAHIVGEVPNIRSVIPEIPERLEQVLHTVLAKDPKDRYQTPIEFAEALQPFASFENFYSELQKDGAIRTSSSRLSGSHTHYSQVRKPFNRTKLILALVLIHCVVFGGFFAGAWYFSPQHPQVEPSGTVVEPVDTAEQQAILQNQMDLALLPGLNGNWWFDEIPWYLPAVRAAVSSSAGEVKKPKENTALPNPDLYNSNVFAAEKQLRDIVTEQRSKLLPDEQILTDKLYAAENTEVFYKTLLNAFENNHPQRGTDWHTQALLEHKLALLTNSEEYTAAATQHYGSALKQYRSETESGNGMSRRLEFLCLADFARLPADFKIQKARFEVLSRERKTGERLSPLFWAEYRGTFGAFLSAAGQFDDTQFTRGIDSLQRDKEQNKNHPLTAYLNEQYGWSLLAQWQFAGAEKLLTDALLVRATLLRTTNDPAVFLQAYKDNNARGLTQRYLGNFLAATDTYRKSLQRIEEFAEANKAETNKNTAENTAAQQDFPISVQTLLSTTKEQLADCMLFGGAASELPPARLAEMQKLYEEAQCSAKNAAALLLLDKTEDAKKLLADETAKTDLSPHNSSQHYFAAQLAEALLIYKSAKKTDNANETADSKKPLRQFCQQFVAPNNPLGTLATRRDILDLRFFAAEFLLSEARKNNDTKAMSEDLLSAGIPTFYFMQHSSSLPYIRRICYLLTNIYAHLHEHQSGEQLQKENLDKIIYTLTALRKKPEAANTRKETAAPPPATLPTLLVFFLTDKTEDGFVIFYPQDGRKGKIFRLPLTRYEVKSGKKNLKLPSELVRLLEDEKNAGRTVEKSWSDEPAYALPELALTDADYPF
ncbi:hypothetical protein FACS189419_08270 [Planctomycetales bacterium]|nr:hypothetical protein FACS189419_08270 [Planctomycetales bacterium]